VLLFPKNVTETAFFGSAKPRLGQLTGNKKPAVAGWEIEMSGIPDSYWVVKWRNTLPIDADGFLGVGFDMSNGHTLRVKLSKDCVRQLIGSLEGYLAQSQSATEKPKYCEAELAAAAARGDIAECKRLVAAAGLDWDATWDPPDAAQ
jgi:hypothetical protein